MNQPNTKIEQSNKLDSLKGEFKLLRATIPLLPKDIEILNRHLRITGIKKGRYIGKAIREKLERDLGLEPREPA